MTFDELGLSPELLRAVQSQGYNSPTPIQAQAIPVVLAGQDVLAAAQTGTGKTAAFTLPILAKLQKHANTSASPARHPLRALILTPTRELADQVADSVSTYSQNIPLRSFVAFGGVDMNGQTKQLREGVEILVATPGRLLDHVQQKNVNLGSVEILVLDEADRMLDMGFILDIRKIISMTPAHRQTLLFSATFAPEIKKLAADFMKSPKVIEVARVSSANSLVTQCLHPAEAGRKRAILAHLIRHHEMSQVIVFCRTKQTTERLGRELKRDGFAAEAIHGDRTQQSRLETLAAFKEGGIKVLVATDVAARGLDVAELPYVVNFELPGHPEDYVHRIGRTGRAGSSGVAISLVAPEEERQFDAIKKLLKQSLELSPIPGWSQRQDNRSEFRPAPSYAERSEGRQPPRRNESAEPERRVRPSPQELDEMPDVVGKRSTLPPLRPSIDPKRAIPALLLPPRYPVNSHPARVAQQHEAAE